MKNPLGSTVTDESSDCEQGLTSEELAERDAVVPPLLMRAYHLPNYNWMQDWVQYMTNNHPITGICWHHRFHPVKRTVRIFSLIGSVLFGLAITNIIYLAFVFSAADYDKQYMEVSTNATLTGQADIDGNVSALSVTNGNIALWTIGAALHATYDNVIWALAACACCAPSGDREVTERKMARYRSTGVFLVMFSVVVVTALCTFAVALRNALDSDDVDAEQVENYGLKDENVDIWQVNGANDFEFLIAYLVELGLNYLVYYPVIGTILFSGILTCGRYQVTGGRPYELKEEAAAKEEGDEVVLEDGKYNKVVVAEEQPRKSKSKSKSTSKKSTSTKSKRSSSKKSKK